MARGEEPSRLRLVGMEMLLRLYMGGETTASFTEAPHAETKGANQEKCVAILSSAIASR